MSDQWRSCTKCQSIFYCGGVGLGVCPAGAEHSSSTGNSWYVVPTAAPAGVASSQSGWRRCCKCEGLYDSSSSSSVCRAGGAHDATGSASYVVATANFATGGQAGWARCGQCQQLFNAGNGSGRCAAGGTHVATNSPSYSLQIDTSLSSQLALGERALRFDGVDDYVELAWMDLDFSRGLTIEAWVFYDEFRQWSRIVDIGNGTSSDNIVFAQVAGAADANLMLVIFVGGVSKEIAAINCLGRGKWMHLAATIDSTGVGRIYRNGEKVAEGALHLPARVARKRGYIGKSNWGDALFKGGMSDMRLWTRARSQREIQADMNRRLSGNEEGLGAYWRLDEAADATTFDDASRNALTGVRQGDAALRTSTLAPLGAARAETRVLSLNGSDGHVALPALDIDCSKGFTIEAWVRCAAPAVGTARLIDLGNDAASDNIVLSVDAVNRDLMLHILVGNTSQTLGVRYLQPGKWDHIAVTIDASGNAKIYFDGVERQSGKLWLPASVTRNKCYLGKSNQTTDIGFAGEISDVRLWSGPRTQAEIRANMGRRLVGDETGLQAYWRLDAEDGNIAADARIPSTSAAVRKPGALSGNATWRRGKPELSDWCVGLASVTHEGKVIIAGTSHDGRIYYTVKQSGFEDNALVGATQLEGWEDWKLLALPNQDEDTSVTDREKAELTHQADSGRYFLRSRYASHKDSAAAPVQLISGMDHLYVFRQSTSRTILVDRFVLDGMANVLVPKLEVRFKRSKQRYTPKAPASSNAADSEFDTFDFTDVTGQPFYEPSIELCAIEQLHEGRFAVVLLPTGDPERQRWHFFVAREGESRVEAISIRSGEGGLFDITDHRSLVGPGTLPGILRTMIQLPGSVTSGPAATRFDIQQEKLTESGAKQLVRTATRVLLAVPTVQGTGTLSFAVSLDGTLAEIGDTPSGVVLRADRKDVVLPFSTVDDVRPVGTDVPVQGVITRMERSEDNKVKILSTNANLLALGDVVQIKETAHYDGRYTVTPINTTTFEISAPWGSSDLGRWEKVKQETVPLFDGVITGWGKAAGGKLRIDAINHRLSTNDKVDIVGSSSYSGTYSVSALSTGGFELSRSWLPGEAVNLRLRLSERRGLRFESVDQSVRVIGAQLPTQGSSYTLEAWIRPSAIGAGELRGILGWGVYDQSKKRIALLLSSGGLTITWKNQDMVLTAPEIFDGWHHVAATYDSVAGTRRIFIDGVQKGAAESVPPHEVPAGPGVFSIGTLPDYGAFAGDIAEVRVWSVARTAQQLSGAMHQQLSGREAGLCGYWRLGAISEEAQPKVIDLGPHSTDGIVMNGAHVGGKLLPRNPVGWPANTQVVRFRNDDLIAVTQGATYEESFEYRVIGGSASDPAAFSFAYWGKRSRDDAEIITFPAAAVQQLQPVALSGGWYRAACRFTVPEGAALVRAFEIDGLGGTFTSLEIRRHRMQFQARSISEYRSSATPALTPLDVAFSANSSASLTQLDSRLRLEALLVAERADLVAKIAWAQDIVRTQQILAGYKTSLATEKALLVTLKAKRLAMENELLQFWCKFVANHSKQALDVLEWGARSNTLGQYTDNGASNQRFRCVPDPANSGIYTIVVMYSGAVLEVTDGSMDDNAKIIQATYVPGRDSQRFRFERIAGSALFKILNVKSGRAFDIAGASHENGAPLIQFRSHEDDNQKFIIGAMAESDVTQQARIDIRNKEAVIADLEKKIAELEALLSVIPEGASAINALIAAWQARITAIDVELIDVRSEISTANTNLRSAAHLTPRAMPLYPADARGLRAAGALLSALRPSGRLSAVETCEGDVQLSCFDGAGRLRQVRYDAVADSSDTTFEQWKPDTLRSALAFSAGTHRVVLETGVGGGAEWSAEAWLLSPLPPTTEWNTLFAAANGDRHVVVQKGRWLGSYVEGKGFLGCGYDISRLSPGWHHLAVTAGGSGERSTTTFYIDGRRVGDTKSTRLSDSPLDDDKLKAALEACKSTRPILYIGNTTPGVDQNQPFGLVAEVRIWNCVLTPVEVAGHSRGLLSGQEPGLLAYYTMAKNAEQRLVDVSGNQNLARANDVPEYVCTARIGASGLTAGESALCVEYSTIGVRAGSDQRMALMRRCLACLADGGVRLFADKRVEELDLQWLGNAQFAPTLLGFIEGAPPVPSENLTLQESYAGATAVELSMSDDTTYSWVRAKESSTGSYGTGFVGALLEKDLAEGQGLFGEMTRVVAATTKLYQIKAGFRGTFSDSRGDTNQTVATAQSSSLLSDRLELRGTMEQVAKFPHLGRRFVPKNVGYALVVSSIADVFVTRLSRSGRMIGYQVQPDEKRPPDINTITFVINPAYTMNGSLDGMTGSAGTSERFHRHVPAMRAQNGSRYPASYYRLEEAYQLKDEIERQDRERETYFQNFDARALQRHDQILALQRNGANNEMASRIGTPTVNNDPAQAAGDTAEEMRKKQAAIDSRYADRSAAQNATAGLDGWQKRMNDLRLRAGKRNIVNTYVWDADGGLRSEVQQFASTIEHSIGSSLSSAYEAGFEGFGFFTGIGAELTALGTISQTETLSKSVATGRGFALNVTLDGVESAGITDHKDVPLIPGEKVNRYRFMSFYLEGGTNHFNTFFAQVVDPEWLAGNSEEARALRQIDRKKPNKAWRVLHRVTYVERPALASFGQDIRPLTTFIQPPSLADQVAAIAVKQDQLEQKLDLILALLRSSPT